MNDELQQKAVHKDENTQKELNAPTVDPTGVSPEDSAFLDLLIQMVGDGKIELYKPSSLFNDEVYDKLDTKRQGSVDMASINMLSAIRNIKDLYENGFKDSFQIQNLVHDLRVKKEAFEDTDGDLFII
ncbi:hypothetical protein JKY72_04150 [Candidatus Gracilibacteria bacterium]|nr:hypothetical protein [Candidatus Gracilibacteria bacterium]